MRSSAPGRPQLDVQQIASESLTKLFEHISTSDQLAEDYNVKKEDMAKAEDETLKAFDRKMTTKKESKQVKAEDYPTPEKYLDGAPIPTYYQFQSNLVPRFAQPLPLQCCWQRRLGGTPGAGAAVRAKRS